MPLPSSTSNPDEAVRVYFEVCKPFYTGDILAATDDFTNGRVDGVSQAFAPSAAQLAARIRSIMEARAKYNAMDSHARQQLLERDKDEEFAKLKSPEAIALVKAMVKGFVDSHDEKKKPKTAEEIAKEREQIRRHDEVFADQFIEANGIMVSHSLLRSLGRDVQ